MTAPLQIVGSYLSPYVRKVLAVLHLKGLPYQIDPIVAFLGNDEFTRLSPLRRIPVLMDGDLVLCDSTVICEYLEERHPSPPLMPRSLTDRARARWIEEYADTRIGDVFIWQLFNQVAIGPHVFGRPTDDAVVQKALTQEIPAVMDWLESQAPADGFLFGAGLSAADISVAVFFRNAAFARWKPDPARWPRSASWIQRVLDHDCLARLRPFEDKCIRTPPAQHRAVLRELGAPLMDRTYGADAARAGVMRI